MGLTPIETGVVAFPDGRENIMFAYPCSVVELPDGRLICAYHGRPEEHQLGACYASYSADDGRTWSVPQMTNFVDSMSKVFAGRLPDGRVYVINNACPRLLDRDRLMISLSDDGKSFDRMFILDDSPSRVRVLGYLKGRGHQYPHAIVRDGKLFAIYSVSKEDIVVSAVDIDVLS